MAKSLSRREFLKVSTAAVSSAAVMSGIQSLLAAQKVQCKFGKEGLCCRNCFMGPCRVNPGGKGAQKGICGATAETIVSRNLLRHVAAGTSAHSDHGREIVMALRVAATGEMALT